MWQEPEDPVSALSKLAAHATAQQEAKRAEFRARIGAKSPETLKFLDYMKALYGNDMRLGGLVFADGEKIGNPYSPEECERIARELASERAVK